MKSLFRRKSMTAHFVEIDEGQHRLKRHLTSIHLITIGIGAIIGAGIFVITGKAAALYAGPAVVLSFVIAAIICILVGLCYAELASLIPVSGGAYSYSYIAVGELPAWIVGWAVCGQYMISASTVAVGWSGYFISMFKDFGVTFPAGFIKAPFSFNPELGWRLTGAMCNAPSILLVVFLGVLLSIGIRAAAYFNNVMVVVKLCTIVLFIILGAPFIHLDNWLPFIPENTGNFGEFGWSGILTGAGIVFFAYIGFDTVATLSQDAINPQKDIPRGILGSLFACMVAYIITSLVLVGVVRYNLLNVPDPMAVALDAMGSSYYWFRFIIKIAILAGLTTVVLVQMLGQSRMFLAMSEDGLLPNAFGKVHAKSKTPLCASFITTIVVAMVAGIFPLEALAEIVSITTLFIFGSVCLGVLILRRTHPEFHRSFKVPFVPALPIVGMLVCLVQIFMLNLSSIAQLVGWLILGSIIYLFYGFRNSKVQQKCKRPAHPQGQI